MTTSSARLTAALSPILDTLITPALVIDLDAVAANAAAIVHRLGGAARWRPHLKTCKQAIIIELLRAAGVAQFKVATADELALLLDTVSAESDRPTLDALLAYPCQRASFAATAALARRHPWAQVSVLADSPAHLAQLGDWARTLELEEGRVGVMLDVDLGMDRTGSLPAAWRELSSVPAPLELRGLHGYDGHVRWHEAELAARGYDELCALAEHLGARELGPRRSPIELVTSGTHSYAHALGHAKLADPRWRHTVSPGTIVLSDRRSREAAADIGLRQAAFVATRVISLGPDRVTLDAGSKAISPDVPAPNCAVLDHPELRPQTPSEEHLPCAVSEAATALELGDLVWLVPEHVCTTVNLHREAVWIRDGAHAGFGPVAAAGHRPRV